MRALKKLYTILALGLAMPLTCIGPASAALFEVKIDASWLSDDAVMAFDFTNSDPDSEHRLTISDFDSDGVLSVSASDDPAECLPSPPYPFPNEGTACQDPSGSGVIGTLGRSPPVTISDAGSGSPLITYYQKIAPRVPPTSSAPPVAPPFHISFKFEMSGDPNTAGGSADGFAFSLLDPTSDIGSPLGPGLLILYSFDGACETTSFDGVATCTEVRVPSVPEPAPVTLAVVALLALTCARWAAAASHRRGATRV